MVPGGFSCVITSFHVGQYFTCSDGDNASYQLFKHRKQYQRVKSIFNGMECSWGVPECVARRGLSVLMTILILLQCINKTCGFHFSVV